jgi:hypothetical protein
MIDRFRLFLGDSGGRNGLVLCGIRFPSLLDHYDLWSRPGGPPMITFRFFVLASSQLLVRANYFDRTLILAVVLILAPVVALVVLVVALVGVVALVVVLLLVLIVNVCQCLMLG